MQAPDEILPNRLGAETIHPVILMRQFTLSF
jgi:hypothetical protein